LVLINYGGVKIRQEGSFPPSCNFLK